MANYFDKVLQGHEPVSWNEGRRNVGKAGRPCVPPLLSCVSSLSTALFIGITVSIIVVALSLSACSKRVYYVKGAKPPKMKIIVLPETERGTRPYEVNGERYYPLSEADGFVQYGKASWYGKKFHGRPTASGEIFDMYKKSAAHKTLPLGTYVKVANLSSKKYSVVRVNDRGPFVKGRIIDLSYAAAKEIGLIGPGVAEVKIVALGKEVERLQSGGGAKPVVELADLTEGEFTIQVGAFQDKVNAIRLADRLRVIFDYVKVAVYEDEDMKTLYRVHVSKSKTLIQAGEIERRLEDMGFRSAFIVRM